MNTTVTYIMYGVGALAVGYVGLDQWKKYQAKKVAQNGEASKEKGSGGGGGGGGTTTIVQAPAPAPIVQTKTVYVSAPKRIPISKKITTIAASVPTGGNMASFNAMFN